MTWRIVIVSSRAKLDLQMNYLVIRSEEITKVFLGEISTLMIESTAVSMTAALLSELVKRKIKIIFCDEKRNPISELLPYYGSHDTSMKVRDQVKWDGETCDIVWTKIVECKIRMQRDLLYRREKEEYKLLDGYLEEIEIGDVTNREGHAAKVYFNALFGMDFNRKTENNINAALNYGYSILLSAFNREVVANGYITQLGLFHDNMYNQFNLSSDLMEPFRPLVDECVLNLDLLNFERLEKITLVQVLVQKVMINKKKNDVDNAIKIYTKSVFDAIEYRNSGLIKFYEL